MAQAWHGPTLTDDTRHLGPLALIAPLVQRLDVAAIIDRHLPPDPQLAFSHGQVLSLLLAARLCQPTALINVPAWAADTGADLLWDIPADCLNDDRLGRALDAFFTQRHSILTSVAAQALHLADLPRDRLHFDPTHLLFTGAYELSQPRPLTSPWPPAPAADMPPAHITHGYGDDEVATLADLTLASEVIDAVVCSSSRLVTAHGVSTCPILLDAPDAVLGATLAESLRPIHLRWAACKTCVVEGLTCRT